MKCCGCIPVQIGTVILGIIGLLICSLVLGVLVPYILTVNVTVNVTVNEDFNLIQKNSETFFSIIELELKAHNNYNEEAKNIISLMKYYMCMRKKLTGLTNI